MDLIKSLSKLNKPEYLFQKIEDNVVETQIQKLINTKKANEQDEKEVKPFKDNIEFDDFSKIDIRSGTILEAEKVAKTKKLIKLLIDTGIDKRTVVSGIAEYYKPQDLIGKKVSIIVNLAPKKLRGIMSEGMILMAENSDGKLSFVSPEGNPDNGSEIK